MPCSDGLNDSTSYRQEISDLQSRNDMLARGLCSILKQMETRKLLFPFTISNEIKKWWKEHKKIDKQREKALLARMEDHRKRVSALSKLTEEEKKLLGIHPYKK